MFHISLLNTHFVSSLLFSVSSFLFASVYLFQHILALNFSLYLLLGMWAMVLLYMIHFVTNLPIFSFPMGLMKNVEQEALAASSTGRIRLLGETQAVCEVPHKA